MYMVQCFAIFLKHNVPSLKINYTIHNSLVQLTNKEKIHILEYVYSFLHSIWQQKCSITFKIILPNLILYATTTTRTENMFTYYNHMYRCAHIDLFI